MRTRLAGAALAAALMILVVVPGGAVAANVSIDGTEITYTAANGETNDVTISQSGNSITIADSGAFITGCGAVGASSATCTPPGAPTVVNVDLGDLNDTATNTASPTSLTVWQDKAGNDTITGSSGARDLFFAGSGNDTYHGAHPLDTIDYRNSTTPVDVRLDGAANDGNEHETDNVMPTVPNLGGTYHRDRLEGSSGPNQIIGFSENDVLYGNGGNDVLYGDEVCGPGVAGSAGHDTLWGQAGNDTLHGCGGNDTFVGGGDADSMIGGPGTGDRASYDTHAAGVGASIGGGANDGNATDGPAGARDDIQADVEQIRGSIGNDTLVGDADDNFLLGSSGNDHLTGGGGSDQLRGHSGVDTVDEYAGLIAGTSVTLDNVANDGPDGDNIESDIEVVHGGEGPDTITGSDTAQRLIGRGGNDTIDGRGGADDLDGGGGDDSLLAADGVVDSSIDCGAGAADAATVDLADPPTTGCEAEDRPGGPGSPGSPGGDPLQPGGPGGGTAQPPITTPNDVPAITSFTMSRRRFAVGRARTPATARRKRARAGTVFRYALSEPARVAIRIDKRLPGVRLRKAGRRLRCVRATRRSRARLLRELGRLRAIRRLSGKKRLRALARLRKKRRCVALKHAGTLTRTGAPGANRLPFSGRIGRRPLKRGNYRARILATDAAGATSRAHTVRFKIVPLRSSSR